MDHSLISQFVSLLAALLLLISFAMLSQRRILTLIKLFAWQGAVLAVSTAIVAYTTGQTHLYFSAGLTVLLKVILIPWVLHRLIDKLYVRWDIETLINIPATMLIGIGLVIFAFSLAASISQMASALTRSTLGIAMASMKFLVSRPVHEGRIPSLSPRLRVPDNASGTWRAVKEGIVRRR